MDREEKSLKGGRRGTGTPDLGGRGLGGMKDASNIQFVCSLEILHSCC